MRFVKPLDETLLDKIFKEYDTIITVEDGAIKGGFGSAVAEYMVDNQITHKKMIRLGIPDDIIEHGEQPELYQQCGIDSLSILNKIQLSFQKKIEVKDRISIKD